jgi:hypothetical protein
MPIRASPIVWGTGSRIVRKEHIEIVNTPIVGSRLKEFPGDTLPLPTQAIFPGLLESAYRRELQNLFSRNVLARLWAKDISLWPAEDYQAESMESNLGWLDLPGQLGPLLARAAKIEPAGFEDVVFVTMGISSLAAEAFCACLLQGLEKEPSCSIPSIPILSAPSMKCCTSTRLSSSLPTSQANPSRLTPCSCTFLKD